MVRVCKFLLFCTRVLFWSILCLRYFVLTQVNSAMREKSICLVFTIKKDYIIVNRCLLSVSNLFEKGSKE